MPQQIDYRQSKVPQRASAPPVLRAHVGQRVGTPLREEEEEYPDVIRPGSSAIRYVDRQGNQIIRQGNRQVVIHTEPIPKRRPHWLLYMGIALFVMVFGWIILSALGVWWQTKQDDWKYGVPRTFQMDQYVGQGDSPDHPDHFMAINTGGMIEVVQMNMLVPKDDHIYPITTAIDPYTPVSLSFKNVNHDGKIDMLVTIGDSNPYTVILLNTGTQFSK